MMSSHPRPDAPAPTPPSGTVTLLFTDIEGSTRLWEEQRTAMQVALQRHDALVRHCIVAHGGHVFKTGGDAFCAAFLSCWLHGGGLIDSARFAVEVSARAVAEFGARPAIPLIPVL